MGKQDGEIVFCFLVAQRFLFDVCHVDSCDSRCGMWGSLWVLTCLGLMGWVSLCQVELIETGSDRTGPTTFGPVLNFGFLNNSVFGPVSLVRSGPQTVHLALLDRTGPRPMLTPNAKCSGDRI